MTHSVQADARIPWRVVTVWVAVGALLLVAFASAIGALNRDLYSASGFVGQYLGALERGDASSALEMPGVELTDDQIAAAGLPDDAATVLLRDSVLGSLSDVALLDERRAASGITYVTYRYLLDGESGSTQFALTQTGRMWGVFPTWEFSRSPLATITVDVLHATTFTVNSLTLDTRSTAPAEQTTGFASSASYLAFSPSSYEFSHSSTLLDAPPERVAVTDSTPQSVTVDTRANSTFVSQVQDEVNRYLDECATQTVLMPTGCPFGAVINDRVQGDATWSIIAYPEITIEPGETTWYSPASSGVAHITVEVISLFDGTRDTLDQDEPFTMELDVTVRADDSLSIRIR